MERRPFITAAATTPFLATRAGASTSDPMLAIFNEWRSSRTEWIERSVDEDWETPHMEALASREYAAFDKMAESRATTLEGVICQLKALLEHVDEHELPLCQSALNGAKALAA